MDALKCLTTRRSVRAFTDDVVELEKVSHILEAGRLAPSAGNVMDFRFVVVLEEGSRKKLADAALEQHWMERAPVHIVVCSEPKKNEVMYGERGEKLFAIQNSAAAVENMLLAAHAQGLGACWVGAFADHLVRQIVGIPEEMTPEAIVVVGYPKEVPIMPRKYTFENVVFLHSFGNKMMDSTQFFGEYQEYVQKYMAKSKKVIAEIMEKLRKKLQRTP